MIFLSTMYMSFVDCKRSEHSVLASVAHPAERRSYEPQVAGSIPVGSIKGT